MIIRGYGIELILLREEDIELVRQKRNSELVRRHMEFREEITPAMQQAWFRSVNNERNNYYLIAGEGKKVGLINGAQVDWEKKETGNGGIFIWEESSWNTLVPLSASLLLTDISFLIGLERIYVKVLRDNPKAIAFNKQLGYELLPGQEEIYNQGYVLREPAYRAATEKLKAPLQKLFGERFYCIMDDPSQPFAQKIAALHPQLSEEKKKKFTLVFEAPEHGR